MKRFVFAALLVFIVGLSWAQSPLEELAGKVSSGEEDISTAGAQLALALGGQEQTPESHHESIQNTKDDENDEDDDEDDEDEDDGSLSAAEQAIIADKLTNDAVMLATKSLKDDDSKENDQKDEDEDDEEEDDEDEDKSDADELIEDSRERIVNIRKMSSVARRIQQEEAWHGMDVLLAEREKNSEQGPDQVERDALAKYEKAQRIASRNQNREIRKLERNYAAQKLTRAVIRKEVKRRNRREKVFHKDLEARDRVIRGWVYDEAGHVIRQFMRQFNNRYLPRISELRRPITWSDLTRRAGNKGRDGARKVGANPLSLKKKIRGDGTRGRNALTAPNGPGSSKTVLAPEQPRNVPRYSGLRDSSSVDPYAVGAKDRA